MPSGPSDRAMLAAKLGLPANEWDGFVRAVVNAAHDPALGLDRSVCLRDVVEAARLQRPYSAHIAEWLEREFTEVSPSPVSVVGSGKPEEKR